MGPAADKCPIDRRDIKGKVYDLHFSITGSYWLTKVGRSKRARENAKDLEERVKEYMIENMRIKAKGIVKDRMS